MTLSSIMIKNFKFNFKKYTAYYIANSFIISVILMYGSLMYSKDFKSTEVMDNYISTLVLMVAFSIVFICYTTISFVRYRGKEFGVYLTLGVTTKDLSKLLFRENIFILLASSITGMIVGTIFSRIFYMIIGKILWISNFKPNLNIKMYLSCIGISIIIFAINSIFQMIFVRRLSILQLIKSSSTIEIGKSRIIIGIISLISLIIALYLFPKILMREVFINSKAAINVDIIIIIITPYFIIGSIMCILNKLIKRFYRLYNNNILVLSSLQHKFISFKSVLYLVLVLAAASITFMGTGYAMYEVTQKNIDTRFPYDIAFIENNDSKVSKKDIENSITDQNKKIKEYKILESLNLLNYTVKEDYVICNGYAQLISEDNYNKHMGTNISVHKGEVIQVGDKESNSIKGRGDDIIFSFPSIDKQNQQKAMTDPKVNKFLSTMSKQDYIYINKNKIKYIDASYANQMGILEYKELEYNRNYARVMNNEDYKKIKNRLGQNNLSYDHLIMLKDHKDYKAFNNICDKLKQMSNGKKELSIPLKSIKFKQQYLENAIKENGFMFFSSCFLGIMFLISSGVVLYFKVLTNVDEEKHRVKNLCQLGMTNMEISKVITKELEIIFFIPVIFAIGIVSYLFYISFININDGEYMLKKSLCVFVAYICLQTIAFFITRNKYLREIIK